jgi:L-alanine-DL-glutamate epimerase-like enolase superfamily enzyme
MKITRLETFPIHVPLKPGWTLKTAHDLHVGSPYVILRTHTDEGIIGLGEATVSPRWSGETSPGCVAAIHGLLAPVLIGEDPRDITRLRARMDKVLRFNPFTKAAIEMSLWDIAGKAAGLPVYQLLGGKVRDEMPIRLVIGGFDIPEAKALARQFLDWGVGCLKVKVGLVPTEDLQRVRAVREVAGPDIPITVDANQGWDRTTAKRMLEELREYNILFAEQPIPADDPNDLAELRRGSRIPIMADESVFTAADAKQLIQLRAADILSVYPGKNGGIAATLEITQLARAAGLACSMGSNLELGIATAAMLHLGAAIPTIASERYPGDFIGPLYHQADMLTKPLSLGPKAARVPDGPGLGVELDMDQVERYRDSSTTAKGLGG